MQHLTPLSLSILAAQNGLQNKLFEETVMDYNARVKHRTNHRLYKFQTTRSVFSSDCFIPEIYGSQVKHKPPDQTINAFLPPDKIT